MINMLSEQRNFLYNVCCDMLKHVESQQNSIREKFETYFQNNITFYLTTFAVTCRNMLKVSKTVLGRSLKQYSNSIFLTLIKNAKSLQNK